MIRKLPFLKQFDAKTSAEQGRSMVEILGVLAVIGVLSAGGIYGYSFAMDKHRANDIIYEVNLRANDIWHKYQEMPLPEPSEDGTDFDEWTGVTGTGYQIHMTSHPDVAFKTYVDGVSSRVCKNVVNMNLNSVVQGIRYIQVAQGDGDLIKYTGDASICGENETDNEIVFTSFLDSDGSNNTSGQSGDPCVEDADCMSACGNATCDIDELVCKNTCTGTDAPYCLDNGTDGMCVECLVNDDCKSKGRGYICNEETYACTTLQKTCPSGTFRSQNGACIPCDSGHNYVVLKGELFSDTEDTVDGYTMCQECATDSAGSNKYNRSTGELEEGKAYCDYMCREGVTYQSTTGCVPCSDTNLHNIPNEAQAKSQCLACSDNHAWYGNHDGYWCQPNKVECKDDEFIKYGWPYTCVPCSENRNKSIHIIWDSVSSTHDNFGQVVFDKCNNCPSNTPRYADETTTYSYCFPTCEQPENEEESIAICQANPFDENCKRKWQNKNGECFDCNTITTNNSMHWGLRHTKLSSLCRACGRTVDGEYCVLKENCKPGTFRGRDGFCKPCDTQYNVEIASLEDSGCISNCKKASSDATDYDLNGSIETRWSTKLYPHNQLLCAPICPKNHSWGAVFNVNSCFSCGNEKSTNTWELNKNTLDLCSRDCPNREVYEAWETYCSPKVCPNDGTKKYYKDNGGNCVLCSRDNSGNSDIQSQGNDAKTTGVDLCHACGNRMIVLGFNISFKRDDKFCYKIDINNEKPISGICNNVENENYNKANLNADIKSKADYYVNGDYLTDKNNKKRYFRDGDGYCRDCETTTTYNTTKAQCTSCKNRRWTNTYASFGSCMKGLCTSGFFLSNSSCIACSNINKPIDPSSENLCSSCDNRRQMEIGTPETTWSGLCVEECAGLQWQDINGNCLSCSEGGERQIGTDAESRRLCNECDGLREAQPIYGGTGGTEVIGYKCILK